MIGKVIGFVFIIGAFFPIAYLLIKRKGVNADISGPQKEDWMFIGIFSIISFLTFGYTDIYVTARNSCELINCILQGRIQEFYLTESVYTLPTYIVYAIWNIPFYAFEKIVGTGILEDNIYYVIFNLWNKILPYLFTLLFVEVTVKFTEDMELSTEKRKWIKYLMLSSPILIFSQLLFGQYDTFWLVFLMMAMRELLKNNKDKFALWVGVAASFKVLPIIIAIPLLLIVEKRITKLLRYGIEMCILPGLFEIIKMLAPKSELTSSFMGSQIKGLFSTGFEHKYGTLSIFLMFYVLICIFLYTVNWKEMSKEKKYKMVLYVSVSIFSVMFALMEWHPQWFLMFVPFVVISMLVNENVTTQIYIDIVTIILLVIMSVIIGSNSDVNETMIQQGVLSLLKGNVTENRLYGIYTLHGKMNVAMYHSCLSAVVLSQIVIHFPKRLYLKKEHIDEVPKILLWGRTMSLYIFELPVLILFFYV